MSDTYSTPAPTQRSAPLITIIVIMVGFALFFGLLYYVYLPRHSGAFTDDGMHTAQLRKKNLAEMHAKQGHQATSYGWVDQKAGVVQLPLDRAMDLTVQKYSGK